MILNRKYTAFNTLNLNRYPLSESVFSKVFSYRQRDNHSPLENFLTEIFSFCIEADFNFRKDFFTKILNVTFEKTDINISTQEDYLIYGRPDIEITYDTTAILIECKVEANERKNQLKDYASILTELKTNFSQLHVVFLTKYFEHKEIADNRVQLHLIRWFEVYELISENHNQITQQLKSFLKEQNMEKVKNFTIQDLLAMKTITETITKMDELLEQFKPEFGKIFGGYSKDSSRSTRLPNKCYINYVTLKYKAIEYYLLIGFFWWWDNDVEIPCLGLAIELPRKKFESSDLIDILDKELVQRKKWEFENWESISYFTIMKPISDFITQNDDNIPSMKKYIASNLQTLVDVKMKYPMVLTK